MRSRRLRQECKLKLQLCAIMSQTQNHSEALDNARKSVKLVHQMFKDMEELCQIYVDKINFKENLLAAQEQSDLEDDEREQIISMVLDSSPAKEIPKNFLEQSISLAERLSIKLCPVIKEVRKRLVGALLQPQAEKKKKDEMNLDKLMMPTIDGANLSAAAIKAIGIDTSAIEELDIKKLIKEEAKLKVAEVSDAEEDEDLEEEKPDMRSVLGFLNQNEWIFNLNIGNIMQIQPISMKDFLNEPNDELELSRDLFLEKLSILTVSYFCMSTEMRFLLQSRANFLKPEVKRERDLESEYWHAKALEIACTFLPSECPLFNHVLLSYQKHHDPSLQPINEDEESKDVLQVLRPLKGIEHSKYQPIIRALPQVKVNLSPCAQKPLKLVLMQNENDEISEVMLNHQNKQKKVGNLYLDKEIQVNSVQDYFQEEPNANFEYGFSKILPKNHIPKSSLLDSNDIILGDLGNEIIDTQDIILDVFDDDSQAIHDTHIRDGNELVLLDQKEKIQTDQLNQLEMDLLKSGGQSPDIFIQMQQQLPTSNAIHSQIQKINKEIDSMYLINDNTDQIHNSLDCFLEKQILEGVDSPDKANKKCTFDSHDSIMTGEALLAEDTADSKLYDNIIQKIIDNPKIDKRTLMQRFIAKIEMESNNAGSMANELNQIKQFVKGLVNQNPPNTKLFNGTINAEEQFYSDYEDQNQFNEMRSLGDEQINHGNSSIDQIYVPQESSGVFHIGLKNLVQVSSNVPNSNNLQSNQIKNNLVVRKQSVQKYQPLKKQAAVGDVKEKRKPQGQLKAQIFGEIRAQTSLRAPNHNLSQHTASSGPGLISGEVKMNQKRKNHQKRENKESKNNLEQDSIFKDIENTSEYQGMITSVASHKNNLKQNDADSTKILDRKQPEEDQQKTQSIKKLKRCERSKPKFQLKNRVPSSENRNSSERKLSSQSRPSTAMTNPTRHSSAFLKKKKKNNFMTNQTNNEKPNRVIKYKENHRQSKSNSSSSAKRKAQRQNDQDLNSIHAVNLSTNQQLKYGGIQTNVVETKSKENFQQTHQNAKKLANSKQKNSINKKRFSNQQEQIQKKERPASSMAIIEKQNHNISQQSQQLIADSHDKSASILKPLNKNFQKRYNLSQTKLVCHQKPNPCSILPRKKRNNGKQVSASKSSGKKKSHSGSTKKSKSKSLASGSEQNRRLQNELAQASFDMVLPEGYMNQKSQTTGGVRRNNTGNQSLYDLQRQVLQNQKMLVEILNQQRSGSGDSAKQHQNFLQQSADNKFKLRILKQDQQQNQLKAQNNLLLQAQSLLLLKKTRQQPHQTSQQFDSQIIDLNNLNQANFNTASQHNLMKNKRKPSSINKNSASQQVHGLSKIIQPQMQNQSKQVMPYQNTEKLRKSMNKTLNYLRQLSKQGNGAIQEKKSSYQDLKLKVNHSQEFEQDQIVKQGLINEVNYLKNKMQEQLLMAQKTQQANQSPRIRNNSNSQKRSCERLEKKRSNSRSPSQPAKACIPKVRKFFKNLQQKLNQKKQFEKIGSQGQYITATTGLGLQKQGQNSASVNQILNYSAEDIAKLIMPPEQSDFDAQINKNIQSLNNILPQRILLKAKNATQKSGLQGKQGKSDGKNFDQIIFEGQIKQDGQVERYRSIKRHAEQFQGQIVPMVGDSHHSVSMFDSEINLSNNQSINGFLPLQHQLSQNEIFVEKQAKQMKGEGLTPKNNRMNSNFATNPNHSMSLQHPEGKQLGQGKSSMSKGVLKKAFDRQQTNRSVMHSQNKMMTSQGGFQQLIR